MIDWMKSDDVDYEHVKKRAYDKEDWRHWRPGPPEKAEHKTEREAYNQRRKC